MAIDIFCSYSHQDENFKETLKTHLKILERNKIISSWDDRRISPGDNWEEEININLEKAKIILLLVSADFLASDYCYDTETIYALDKESRGEAKVIPIIVRPCAWTQAQFKYLQALPTNGQAITLWKNEDEAWTIVAEGILKAAKEMEQLNLQNQPFERMNFSEQTPDNFESDLEELTIKFLRKFNRWYFSPLRILKWGSKQQGFEKLRNFQLDEIKSKIVILKSKKKVEVKKSKMGNPIYKAM